MKASSRGISTAVRHGLKHDYSVALHRYLACSDEGALSAAYELGRRAFNTGMGPLDLVSLHQAALEHVPTLRRSITERPAALRATGFLMESLSPFEMTYRRFLEATAALRGINEALESESRRTARLIHDGAGQILFSMQLALAEAMSHLPSGGKAAFDPAMELADRLDRQLRSLSRDLYPVALDDLGLSAAVQHLLEGVETRTGLKTSFASSLPDQLPSSLAFCLYRAVQEAVTNVVRHARAKTVEVTMEKVGERVTCSVKDDGVGFENGRVRTTGLGLLGIRQRLKGLHGNLELTSSPGQGTQLVMSVPLDLGVRCDEHQSPDR